jgi:hypothetical protein
MLSIISEYVGEAYSEDEAKTGTNNLTTSRKYAQRTVWFGKFLFF